MKTTLKIHPPFETHHQTAGIIPIFPLPIYKSGPCQFIHSNRQHIQGSKKSNNIEKQHQIMKSFWNKTTIAILACAIILPSLNIIVNYHYNVEDLGIANSITLLAVFITILSTFYSNYKSDERVEKQIKTSEKQFRKQLRQNEKNLNEQLLFDKKQKIYSKLYEDLNRFWEVLDHERVQFHINTDPTYMPYNYLSCDDFSKLHSTIGTFYASPDFLYMPLEIQKIIINFLEYVNSNLEYYYYEKIDNLKEYNNAADILSEIYPLLKEKIGLKR